MPIFLDFSLFIFKTFENILIHSMAAILNWLAALQASHYICSLLALGQILVIVTMFPCYPVSQTHNYPKLPYTSTQNSCQVNQSKVTWQHSMLHNCCTRHKCKCANKPTDAENIKQSQDQLAVHRTRGLAVHRTRGWLVKITFTAMSCYH